MSRALGVESGNQLDVVGASAVLEIEDLKTHFFTASGVVKTVDGAASSITSPDIRQAILRRSVADPDEPSGPGWRGHTRSAWTSTPYRRPFG